MKTNTIHNADIFDKLPELDYNSLDAIVTDPPYNLKFMGKSWDDKGGPKEFQKWNERWASIAYDKLKPGGYMVAFGGTKTYHRMVSGVEDAGFVVKDMIEWMYGTGFPKSYNISKGFRKTIYQDWLKGNTNRVEKWQGWGTALKPAHEPLVLAQKPREGTYCNNVEKYGCGGLNIDECRSEGRFPANLVLSHHPDCGDDCVPSCPVRTMNEQSGIRKSSSGSFKADDYEERETATGFTRGNFKGYGDKGGAARYFNQFHFRNEDFFRYTAKASKSERTCDGNVDNDHPTVKPLELMEWLVRLVTPPEGVVVDPFCGSGTTLIAAYEQNINYIGIEKDEDSVEIARERLDHNQGPEQKELV